MYNWTRKQKIERCWNSRKGKNTSPQLCNLDWCNSCSQTKTNWVIEETLRMLNNSPQFQFVTIILEPVSTYEEGKLLAIEAMIEIHKLGINSIGAYELGTEKDSPGWNAFRQVFPYKPVHRGVPHLHIITERKYLELDSIFPIKNQCLQIQMGIGMHSSKTYKQNVSDTVEYYRKRSKVINVWWLESASDQQETFKLNSSGVFLSQNCHWIPLVGILVDYHVSNDVMVLEYSNRYTGIPKEHQSKRAIAFNKKGKL